MTTIKSVVKQCLNDITIFSEAASLITLRKYQVQVAKAVADSVIYNHGYSFVVMFPRQSGKNELQAQIECYLLTLMSQCDAEIVKVSPTWKPQSINAMRRLERVVTRNLICRDLWCKESGYIYKIGSARIFFFSGSPEANIVGATASTLLEVDEAQDVQIAKYDKDIAPMAASTNATRVFWGTAWTSRTLLTREFRAARAAEQQDGIRRTFILTADQVAQEVPAYGKFVAGQVAKLGRSNPMVRTQFFSEEIDAEGGLFPPYRLALMQGLHEPQLLPSPGKTYAILVDVAGADESSLDPAIDHSQLATPRDSTALTIVEVDHTTLADDLIHAPTYRVVYRQEWLDVKHSSLYGQFLALADLWKPRYFVVDATGIGAGLASFLAKSLPSVLIPFIFSAKTKSELGWSFITVIESGRFKDYAKPFHINGFQELLNYKKSFFNQLSFVTYEAKENRTLSWSVPNGTRDPSTGELVHDDWVLSAALCAVLDEQSWGIGRSQIIQGIDPMEDMSDAF